MRRKGYHLLLPYGVTGSDPVGSASCGRTHLIQMSTPSFLLQMRMDGYSTKMVAIPSTGKTLRYNRKLRAQSKKVVPYSLKITPPLFAG